jgi:molybdenum cofactor cytidylyltransferase
VSGTGLVILAAGASTRMGRPKQLLEYRGRTLIHQAIGTAVDSVCQPIIVVLGAYTDRIKPKIESAPVTLVINPDWFNGMSTSLRVGVETLMAISPNRDALVLMLCDQPYVSTSLINQLVETSYTTKHPIVASQYAGVVGVPALFTRTLFPFLTTLQGDTGARQVIQQFLPRLVAVPFPEGAFDIDTPTDYARLTNKSSKS